jgi:molybdopterin synthase sulfur carrier subunit
LVSWLLLRLLDSFCVFCVQEDVPRRSFRKLDGRLPPECNPSFMPLVTFAPALTRHVACAPQQVAPGTLATVLQQAFAAAPALRGYVLDEQGAVRKHVAVFVNGKMIPDRAKLDAPLGADDQVHVIQALTGG